MDLQALLKTLSQDEKQALINLIKTEGMNNHNEATVYCPKCGCFHFVKYGKFKGHQKYKCVKCGTYFTEYHNTILHLTKKKLDLWKSYICLMFEGKTIKQAAEQLGICIQTSFRWRHKILSILEQKFMNDTVKGIVEADETFLLEAHKGIKGNKKQTRKRGQSNEQTDILIAVDRGNNIISKVYGSGKISSDEVSKVLKGHIEEKSTLVTDGCTAYREFAKNNQLTLKQLVKIRKNGVYHINNCNAYQAQLKKFFRKFNGVSTKYLNRYLAWFKFTRQKNDINYLFNHLILG